MEALRKTGRRHVVMAGIETHICVYQTARDLLKNGYEVHLPADDLSVFAARQQKLQRELEKVDQERAKVDKKLNNPDFLLKAPEEVVTKERDAHARLMDTRTKLLQQLERIEHLLRPA